MLLKISSLRLNEFNLWEKKGKKETNIEGKAFNDIQSCYIGKQRYLEDTHITRTSNFSHWIDK